MGEVVEGRFLGLTPYLYYEDAAAALAWLARVFGFREEVRYLDDQGIVAEAEMSAPGVRIMMAGRAPGEDEGAGQLLIVHVEDVDAVHARVIGAGVTASGPEDKPSGPRVTEVRDPWGYRWSFWQQVRQHPELPDGWQEIRADPATHDEPTAGTASDLFKLVFGYAPAQIIHVAARLAVADQLVDGARTSTEVAAATQTHPRSMYRLLRALACLGVVNEIEADHFELTPTGASLETAAPDSIRALTMLFCGDETWRSWGELEYSVRTGKPAWDKVTGMSTFEFFAQHPEQSATFNAAMAEHTGSIAPAIIAAGEFSRFGRLVDVGGGDGTLIAAILQATPGLRGVLFDLPAGAASAAKTLDAAGVADRCDVVTGDFFVAVPEGADAYLIKSVIHDWDDERAIDILRSCHRAMPSAATLLVVEPVLPPVMRSPEVTGTVISDINMLVNTGGRERTEQEFATLFHAAGFQLTTVSGHGNGYRVIEGSPL